MLKDEYDHYLHYYYITIFATITSQYDVTTFATITSQWHHKTAVINNNLPTPQKKKKKKKKKHPKPRLQRLHPYNQILLFKNTRLKLILIYLFINKHNKSTNI